MTVMRFPKTKSRINTANLILLSSLLLCVAARRRLHHRPLENDTLRCCTLIAPPFIERSDRRTPNGFDGLAIEYLSLLQERTGFDCSSLELFKDVDDVGWEALINNLVECTENGTIIDEPHCNCDIGIGPWWDTEERIGVDFLPAFAYDSLTVLVNVEDMKTTTGGIFFVTAFSWDVWGGLFVLFVLFSCLKVLDVRFAPPDEYVNLSRNTSRLKRLKYCLLKSRILYRLRRGMQSTADKMMLQTTIPIKGDNSSERQRILNLVIMLTGLFFMLVYEASMTTMLVQETVVSEFESVDDFKTCRIDDRDVCLVRGDATMYLWNATIKTSSCRANRNYDPSQYNSYEALLTALANRECKYAIVDDSTALTAMHGKFCGKLMRTGEPFFQGGVSFALPRRSPLLWELRLATLQIRAVNGLDTKEEYLTRGGVCEADQETRLDWNRMKIFFAMAYGFCVLLFLEMIVDPQTSMRGIVEEDRIFTQEREVQNPAADGS